MTDPSQMSDAELLAALGMSAPAAPTPPPRAAPRPPAAPLPGDPQETILGVVPGARITSAKRSPERNRAVGGAPGSYHLRGQAFDLVPPDGMSMAQLEDQLRQSGLPFAELLNEGDHVHVAWSGAEAPQAGPTPSGMSDAELLAAVQGYEVVNSQDLAPTDTPESLRDQGYELDPERNVWARVVGRVEAPQDPASPGFELAMQQGRERQALMGDLGQTAFADQATAPINDELAWLAGYGSQGIGNLIRNLTGQDIEVSALDRARAERALTQEGQESFQRENPGQAIAGGVLGGFAFAPGRAAAAVPLLGRLGQAGGVSAAYGAAEGDGVGGRAGAAALSGLLGVATAGALEGVAPLTRGALRGIERARAPRDSLPNRQEARVGSAIENAIVTRDQMTPDQVIANMAEGRLPFAAGGENLLGLAETAAQAPGQARAALVNTAREVQDGATNRVQQQLSDQFGADGNFYVTLRDRVRQQRDTAKQGMAQMADTPVPLDDASVQAFRSSLSSRAVRDAAEEAIADMSPEGAAAANRLFGLGDQVLDNPGAATITVREAQDISYALREAASRAYRGGFNSRGEALQSLSTAIRQNARDRVKPYDAWLKQYGDDAEANDALRVGKNLFARPNERNAMSVPELRERWADWSDLAKENFRLGVGEAVLDRVRAGGGVPALRRVLKDQDVAERIALAFGDEDGFARFMQFATDETTLQGQLNQILGNSATARRQAGRADLEAQGMDPLDFVEGAADLTNPISAAGRVSKEVLRRLPRKDRSILGNEELNGLLGRALTDETEMTRLLNLLQNRSALNNRVAGRARALGLLSTPAVAGAGQERVRGLLTATP